MIEQRNRIPAIDGLRGFCAVYVLMVHQFSSDHPVYPLVDDIIYAMAGWAVRVFFCASGFLVFSSYQRRVEGGSFSVVEFYIRRFFRIVPLWWLILFVLYFGVGGFSLGVLAINMSFIFGLLSFNKAYVPVDVSWSLFVEEVFYLLFPLLFSAARNHSRILLYLVASYILAIVWQSSAQVFGAPFGNAFIFHSPLAHFQFFFLGIAIQQFYRNGQVTRAVSEKIWRFGLSWFDLFCILLVAGYARHVWFATEVTIGIVLLTAITPGTLLHRLMSNSLLRWAGVRCYCIYMAHYVVSLYTFGLVEPLLRKFNYELFSPAFRLFVLVPVNLTATLAVAAISFVAFEKPMMKLGEWIITLRRARVGSKNPVGQDIARPLQA